jgi:transposase
VSTKNLYVDTMASDKVVRRRRYGDELKAQVLGECDAPGASVAKVAMAHGINANVVHRWRQLAREGAQVTVAKPSEFVPVAIATPTPLPRDRRDIEVELRRGAVTMKVLWPSSAAADFATWTRELLR